MSTLGNSFRTALYNALNGNVTYTVYHIPPSSADSYVVISDISEREQPNQTWREYDIYATIEIVTQFQKTGNRDNGLAVSKKIDDILRPTLTGSISFTGYNIAGCWLDDQYENLSNENAGKYHRIVMSYYFKVIAV